jgi:hypothetical protein
VGGGGADVVGGGVVTDPQDATVIATRAARIAVRISPW